MMSEPIGTARFNLTLKCPYAPPSVLALLDEKLDGKYSYSWIKSRNSGIFNEDGDEVSFFWDVEDPSFHGTRAQQIAQEVQSMIKSPVVLSWHALTSWRYNVSPS